MHQITRAACVALASAVLLGIAAPAAHAQDPGGTAIVSIYRIAPGKHLAFLKWMAAREAAAREAGVPETKWYRHLDGDSWDYVAIAPDHDATLDAKADAAAKKRGLTTGMKAGMELRELMAFHTDTIAAGPATAEELVQEADRP
ncbi:MAG TPA: hypothetical protein VM619_10055 [Luteimonas sp.]|nr:hypothetical protein [Luteimonas sp.]